MPSSFDSTVLMRSSNLLIQSHLFAKPLLDDPPATTDMEIRRSRAIVARLVRSLQQTAGPETLLGQYCPRNTTSYGLGGFKIIRRL